MRFPVVKRLTTLESGFCIFSVELVPAAASRGSWARARSLRWPVSRERRARGDLLGTNIRGASVAFLQVAPVLGLAGFPQQRLLGPLLRPLRRVAWGLHAGRSFAPHEPPMGE